MISSNYKKVRITIILTFLFSHNRNTYNINSYCFSHFLTKHVFSKAYIVILNYTLDTATINIC